MTVAPTRRLFIAVMLPAHVREHLADLSRLLEAHRAILRPTRTDGLHVTLRFLGETTAEQEQRAIAACEAATAGVDAFLLAIGGFGAFPHMRRPRVVWLDLQGGAEPLAALHGRLQEELAQRGILPERESFAAHLTLARVRADAAPDARAALGAAIARLPRRVEARCSANAVSLVHSTLAPGGSRYTVLREWPLHRADPRV